jgi:hypothetical protein
MDLPDREGCSRAGAGYLDATVHHGHHHGADGFLLAATALLLSRLSPTIRPPRLRAATAAYLSLMLVYALWNLVNDLWIGAGREARLDRVAAAERAVAAQRPTYGRPPT